MAIEWLSDGEQGFYAEIKEKTPYAIIYFQGCWTAFELDRYHTQIGMCPTPEAAKALVVRYHRASPRDRLSMQR